MALPVSPKHWHQRPSQKPWAAKKAGADIVRRGPGRGLTTKRSVSTGIFLWGLAGTQLRSEPRTSRTHMKGSGEGHSPEQNRTPCSGAEVPRKAKTVSKQRHGKSHLPLTTTHTHTYTESQAPTHTRPHPHQQAYICSLTHTFMLTHTYSPKSILTPSQTLSRTLTQHVHTFPHTQSG